MNRGERRLDISGSQYASSDDDSIETMSMLSVDSTVRRGSLDNDSVEEEQPVKTSYFEDRVKQYLGEISDTKSSPRRNRCLRIISTAFAARYSPDFLADRPATMADLIEKSLKKGKTEEQIAATNLAAILVLQYGASPEGAEIQRAVSRIFITNLRNDTIAAVVRERMAAALAVTTFIAEGEVHRTWEVMEQLAAVFSCACGPLDELRLPIIAPPESKVHQAALLGWGLLLTIAEERAYDLIDKNLATVTALLHSADVDVRVAAGEVLALMYEVARDYDSDFEGDDLERLCEELHTLATDSKKYRAKRDRRMQRASFRKIEGAVRDGDKPKLKVRFGRETLAVRTWEDKRIYDAVCGFLGSGMNHHLMFNPEVRTLFHLGPPIQYDSQTGCSGGRIGPSNAELKLRTKQMAKCRDKRTDFV